MKYHIIIVGILLLILTACAPVEDTNVVSDVDSLPEEAQKAENITIENKTIEPPKEEIILPDNIVESAESFMISNYGDDYFRNYMTLVDVKIDTQTSEKVILRGGEKAFYYEKAHDNIKDRTVRLATPKVVKIIKDNTYGEVYYDTFIPEGDDNYSVYYYEKILTYKLRYALEHPEVPEYSDPFNILDLSLDTEGAIFRTRSIMNCTENPKKCPPFGVSKTEAIEIIKELIPYEDRYDPYVIYRDNYNNKSYVGYVWSYNYACSQRTGPGSSGARCKEIEINPENGDIVYFEA